MQFNSGMGMGMGWGWEENQENRVILFVLEKRMQSDGDIGG